MKWLFVVLLSLIGTLVGWADVYVLGGIGVLLVWLVVFVGYSFLLYRIVRSHYFLYGLLLGIGCWVWVAGVHLLLFKDYLHTHTDLERIIQSLPSSGDQYAAMLIIDLAKALFLSFVMGCFAVVVPKALKR